MKILDLVWLHLISRRQTPHTLSIIHSEAVDKHSFGNWAGATRSARSRLKQDENGARNKKAILIYGTFEIALLHLIVFRL